MAPLSVNDLKRLATQQSPVTRAETAAKIAVDFASGQFTPA